MQFRVKKNVENRGSFLKVLMLVMLKKCYDVSPFHPIFTTIVGMFEQEDCDAHCEKIRE